MIRDFMKKVRVVFSETISSFERNNDFTAASSLAFSATLALIPALFLLTFILGTVIGSSEWALTKTQELLLQWIPAYSTDIIREVQFISSHAGTIGVLNLLVLIWSVTPLVADMRILLSAIFRKKPTRPFLLEKLFDVAISIIFLIGLSAVAVAGVIFTLMKKKSLLYMSLGYIEGLVPFVFITAVVFLLYLAFSAKARISHLAIGSLVTSVLWFTMTPAFHLFITYNPGYGFAFGSFKSLFVAIIWIYYSFVVFLLGAEISASLGRENTVFIKHLVEGGKNVPADVIGKYVLSYEKGSLIFAEGDPGTVMYGVHKGSVELRKGDAVIDVIQRGKCFGAISFLLSLPRRATAMAREDTEVVVINNENIYKLMNEYPEFVIEILKEIAVRLRAENKTDD